MIKTKQQYDNQRENAARRMSSNALMQTLTDEQHAALELLCTYRHDIHCNWSSLFNSQSSDYSRLWELIDSDGIESIKSKLDNVGMKNKLSWDRMNIPSDYDYDTPESEGGFGIDDYDEAYEIMGEFLGKVNNDIELFLKNIDEKHDTNYAPTCALRI